MARSFVLTGAVLLRANCLSELGSSWPTLSLMAVVCVPVVVVPVFQKVETVDSLSELSTEMASDAEHSHVPPPCSDVKSDVCADEMNEDTGCLVVRGTFLDDGQSLMQKIRKLRRAKTDFALHEDPAVYEPGKFSEEHCQTVPSHENQASHQLQPEVEDHITDKKPELRQGKGKERTTVMLRNLPNNYTREMFLQMLDEHGMKGKYDFVYLPCDFYRDANLGYAFVNMVDSKAVDELWKIFHGFADWALPTAKVCEVSWSGPHQGFKAHIERYRNSPVMHRSVPDEYKPVMFKNGVRKPFPKPTKTVKAPF